ncbi:MAG: flippase-like domain-containing protein [Chloroflexi bacterium]|nr:flippase-like domain-containing protein [Chloroflexota bacterium]MBU1748007.1 flippase-like domain-containing protein [Chloroflexota bacterium]
MRRYGKLALIALISLVFLALALYNIDLGAVAQALSTANYWFLVPATLITLLGYGIRTVRWQAILYPSLEEGHRPGFVRLFPVLVIGFAANNVLPFRAGEFVRAYVLGRREGISASLSFATIVLERVMDGLTLVFYLLVAALLVPLPDWGPQVILAAIILFGGAIGALGLLLFQERLALRLLDTVLRPVPAGVQARVRGLTTSFIAGLRSLRGLRNLLVIAGLSLASWACEIAAYTCLIAGFDLPLNDLLRLAAGTLTMVVVNLGNLIPAAPGYVGTFEAAGRLAMSAFPAVAPEAGLGVILVSHAMQYILITALGFVFLWQMGLSLGQLQQAREQGTEAIDVAVEAEAEGGTA